MSSILRTLLTTATAVATLFPYGAARAETPITLALPGFDSESVAAFQIHGDAKIVGSDLRLTPDEGFHWGAALDTHFATLGPDASFSSYFTFAMSQPNGSKTMGADGLAFLVQTNLTSKRGDGGSIGYLGAGPSVAIEFDTYQNGHAEDPDNNHIGISLDGKVKSIATAPSPYRLNDGNTYHVWVDYDGSKTKLEIRISDSPKRPAEATLSHIKDLSDVFTGAVYIGFSAATGAGHQQHDIKSVYFHREFVEGGLNPDENEYVTDSLR
jgi:hypothetical protein